MTVPAPQKDELSFLDFLASSVKTRILTTLWESRGHSGLGIYTMMLLGRRTVPLLVFASGFVNDQEVLSQVFAVILLSF